jgi:N4-gp56 family major capsid protein
MSMTDYPVNHPLAVKLWSRKLFTEALKQTWMKKFMGPESTALIQELDDTKKGAGDRITVPLMMQLTGPGIQGDATMEGNEESLVTYSDNLLINQLRHSVRVAGKMSEQRVNFNIRESARLRLVDWWSQRIDVSLMNQLAGYTGQADTRYTGNNATIAPSTNNWYFANGLANETEVASGSSSNVFKLKFLDYAVEKLKTNTPATRPIKIDGKEYYVAFLHPYQVTDLRTDAATAGNWFDIQKASLQGGKINDNPIMNGSLGVYNGVILHESFYVPRGLVTGTYRALVCGAQAAAIAYGQGYGGNQMDWQEETFDYGNQFGVGCGLIFGAKKMQFNSQDFSSFVISTYGAAHA